MYTYGMANVTETSSSPLHAVEAKEAIPHPSEVFIPLEALTTEIIIDLVGIYADTFGIEAVDPKDIDHFRQRAHYDLMTYHHFEARLGARIDDWHNRHSNFRAKIRKLFHDDDDEDPTECVTFYFDQNIDTTLPEEAQYKKRAEELAETSRLACATYLLQTGAGRTATEGEYLL